jgi:hypothetical protein
MLEPIAFEVEVVIEKQEDPDHQVLIKFQQNWLKQEVGQFILRSISFFSVWNKEELPEEWKELMIVPIYKKGDKTDCSNNRGISLLSTMYAMITTY